MPPPLAPDDGSEWDVFFSYARRDVTQVRPLVHALRDRGLNVFVDEASIDVYESISERIRGGLAASKLLLAHYSAEYPRRPACQRELVVAFLAGLREGDPRRRVLVVNPEAGGSHIHPIELRDVRWQVATATARDRRSFSARVAEVASRLPGPLGGPGGGEPPRWVPERRSGTTRFVGRFGDLWRVHSALHGAEFVERRPPSPVACVYGLPGVGKTSLVEQYALDFELAFPGGIFWLSASSDAIDPDRIGPAEARRRFLARYAGELRRVAEALGLGVRGMDRERLLRLIAGQLTAQGRPCLWVVDDLPAWLEPSVLPTLLAPSRVVRTIVTSRTRLVELGAPVPLAGLDQEEAVALLTSERRPGTRSETSAATALAAELGGHPLALTAAARALRDRDALVSFSDYRRRIRGGGPGIDSVHAVVVDRLRGIGPVALDVLRLASVLGPGRMPARLIAGALARRHSWTGADTGEETGKALETIADLCLADHSGGAWEVHRLVLDAVDRSFIDDATRTALAAAAAAEILRLPDLDDDAVGHALTLAQRADVPTGDRLALMRLAANQQRSRGDVTTAAALWERVVSLGPGDVEDLIAAADAAYLAGGYEAAIAYGELVLRRARGAAASWRPRLLLARSLDRLGRYPEADARWAELADESPLPPRDRIGLRVARAGGLRMRGRLDAALATLDALPECDAGGDPGLELALLGGRVERARLLLLRERVHEARAIMDETLPAYRRLGLTRHPDHFEAQAVWAEAATVMDPTDLSWSNHLHQDAVARLRQIHDDHERRLGGGHPLTVAAAALLALALLRGGQPREADDLLAVTEREVRAWSEPNLPLLHRISYTRGVAHFRLHRYPEALEILETVHAGQLAVLGARHPDTLDTQMELAVVLMLTGDMARARPLVHDLGKALPRVVGRRSNRYFRWVAVRGFAYLPGPALVATRQIEAMISAATARVRGR